MLKKSMCNNCLETYIGVRRTCIVCGLTEEWAYDLETVQRDIVNDAKDDGWYVGSHGLKCPKCYVKKNYKKKEAEK